MRAYGLVVGVVTAWLAAHATVVAADPKPRLVDISAERSQMVVLKDAEGGIYVIRNDTETTIFYGTGKVLHEQVREGGRSRNGDAWSVSIWAPRLEYPFMGAIERTQDGTYKASCQGTLEHGLSEVTGDKAKAILDRSTFMTTALVRRPYLLARDDSGVYYYVDVIAKQYGGNGFRVFVGRKGAMKQLALGDVASDEAGEVFSTKTGDLRHVRAASEGAKPQMMWIRGTKPAERTELVVLDTYMSTSLIYRTLGIYKIAGTVCGSV